MQTLSFFKSFLPVLIIFGAMTVIHAQNEKQYSENTNQENTDQTVKQTRPNLIMELGLSPDQKQQIRLLNQEKKPLMQAAQQRQRLANQRLDEAIYADNVNETEIQARLKEVQNAHAEVLRFRTNSETAVRRILTPDQLVKFRQLRRQFAQEKENLPKPGQNNADRPNAPLNTFQNRRLKRQRMRILNNMRNQQ